MYQAGEASTVLSSRSFLIFPNVRFMFCRTLQVPASLTNRPLELAGSSITNLDLIRLVHEERKVPEDLQPKSSRRFSGMDTVQSHQDVQRPRRLLHAPTMTSVTWDEAVTQCAGSTPVYNVLSYTWGRFTARETEPALTIHNVLWKIPAIQPAHFTVSEFERVLQSVAHASSGYVWLDVACIDQDNLPLKMDEIGRQADIFRGADQAFIWLTRLERNILEETQGLLHSLDDKLLASEIDVSRFTWDRDGLDSLLRDSIGCTVEKLAQVLSDPWFTSLWALQEANLREDAYILPRSAERLRSVHELGNTYPMRLRDFSGVFQDLFLVLAGFSSTEDSRDSSKYVRDFTSMMEHSGLLTIDLGMEIPLHLYPAAHFRTCGDELDRVYAIMQVYHLRLGSSRAPGQTFELDELEDELAECLNDISPIAAQLFIHRTVPMPGKAWRITSNCMLPTIYYMASSLSKDCTISSSTIGDALQAFETACRPSPIFTGRWTSLTSLIDFWMASKHQREQQRQDWWQSNPKGFHHYQVNIDLDAGHTSNATTVRQSAWRMATEPSRICGCPWCKDHCLSPKSTGYDFDRLPSLLPLDVGSYQVLLIGRTTLYHLTGGVSGYTVNAMLGILGIVEWSTAQPGDRPRFQRVGLCSWEAGYAELKQRQEEIWQPGQFELS